MLKLIVFGTVVLFLFQNVTTSRILAVIPTASYSHQMFFHQLWRELAIRGHEVVVITSDPTNETLANFKEISIRETYVPAKKFIKEVMDANMMGMFLSNTIMERMYDLNEFALQLPQVTELINNRSEHFDLVMIEHLFGPALGFQHRFNCPMIGVISMDGMDIAHEIMGNSVHSILYPTFFSPEKEATIFTRAFSFILSNLINISPYRSMNRLDRMTKTIFGKDTPPISEIYEKTDMLFANANPIYTAIRPLTPSTISIAGGIHMKPEKPLPKDMQTFLDNAKQGAIYFSLGSSVKSNELTIEMRQTVMKTLGQLPYSVLWKFEDDSLVGKPDNVKLTKWAPQQDVLKHKNVKVFVTQCGLQSLEEAVYLHVPLVLMPFFGDQEGNAWKAQAKGLGLVVDKNNLSVETLKSTILEVMENPVYRNTVERVATQIQDTPMTPLERAVWWTEYVLRHKGAQHLKGPRIPFYQFYYLDVVAVIGSVCLCLLGLIFVIVKIFLRKVCGIGNCGKTNCEKEKKLKDM